MRTALIFSVTAAVAVAVTFFGYEIVSSYTQFAMGSLFAALLAVAMVAGFLVTIKDKRLGGSLTDKIGEDLGDIVTSLHTRKFDLVADSTGNLGRTLLKHYVWGRTAHAITLAVCGLLAALGGIAASTIAIEQNKLTIAQEKILENELLLSQQELTLQKGQLEIAEKQTRMLDVQNALAQASRQAVFSGELSIILDKIAEELRELGSFPETIGSEEDYALSIHPKWTLSADMASQMRLRQDGGEEIPISIDVQDSQTSGFSTVTSFDLRMLPSESLLLRIVLFFRVMKPYLVERSSDTQGVIASPEKAQMFNALRLSRVAVPVLMDAIDLSYADFRESTFPQVDFSGIFLEHARFDHCEFNMCKFENQDLRSVVFSDATFFGTSFEKAVLPKPENCYGARGLEPMDLIGATTDDPGWIEEARKSGVLMDPQIKGRMKDVLDSICLVPYDAAASGISFLHPSLGVVNAWESPGYRVCLKSMKDVDAYSSDYIEQERRRVQEIGRKLYSPGFE